MAQMYNWDKSDKAKSKRITQNPSFSSCLLDEIYRSIDGGDEKFGELKVRKQKAVKKQSGGGGGGGGRERSKSKSTVEDEEIASFRQACLVEKWMEMKGNEKPMTGRRGSTLPEFDPKLVVDNDPLFFSSGSSSSDSSFGWYSEAEAVKPKPSCFGPLNKVKTSSRSAVKKQQNEFYPFDDDQTYKTDDNGLVTSKTKALKFYTSLKKVKQPISPGGRLTTFINAIFTNGPSKKSKDLGSDVKVQAQAQAQTRRQRKSKSTNVSTCSSASSFSRSCLSKNTPGLSDHLNDGVRRSVRFLDREDSCPYDRKLAPTTFPWQRTEKLNFNDVLMKYGDKKIDLDDGEQEDEDDMASDSSSDLFELDHLAMFKNDQYCEELPVYETTYIGTNRAIASGLVC